MNTFYVKRHDRLPPLLVTLKDAAGSAVDLDGCTCKFHMWTEGAAASVVDGTATILQSGGSYRGVVQYDWGSADTLTAGEFNCEWVVRSPDGKTVTFPNYENDLVIVTADAPGTTGD